MHVKCLPDARVSLLVSDDGTLRASAQHLSENFMRFASAEPPPYTTLPALGLLPSEKGNLTDDEKQPSPFFGIYAQSLTVSNTSKLNSQTPLN